MLCAWRCAASTRYVLGVRPTPSQKEVVVLLEYQSAQALRDIVAVSAAGRGHLFEHAKRRGHHAADDPVAELGQVNAIKGQVLGTVRGRPFLRRREQIDER